MNRKEIQLLMDFVNDSRKFFSNKLASDENDADWKIIFFLMKQHFKNKLTTTKSLIQASGLPFTTGLRRVNSLVVNEILVKRPKTKTGKSFSIHPSEALINDFNDFLNLIKNSVAHNLGFEKNVASSFNFGTSLSVKKIIPPPHPLIFNQEGFTKKITIAANFNPTFKIIQSNKSHLENILGVKINLQLFDLKDLRKNILKNNRYKKSRFDIVAFNLPWLGELHEKNILLPLNTVLYKSKLNLLDFHASALESCTIKNQILGIPIETMPDILFYRKDILKNFNLPAPQNNKQLFHIANILKKNNPHLTPISWPGKRGHDLGSFFIETMANYGQPYVNLRHVNDNVFDSNHIDKNIRPKFLSKEAVESARFIKYLIKFSSPNISSMTYDDCVKDYAKGNSSMVFSWASRASLFEFDKNSPAYQTTGYLPRPAGKKNFQLSAIGGFSLSIPRNIAKNKIDFNLNIIKNLTSPQLIKYYIEQGSLSCSLLSVMDDIEVNKISPIFESIKLMEINSKLHQWPRASIPQYSNLVEIVGEEMFDFLFSNKSMSQALENCQKKSIRFFN